MHFKILVLTLVACGGIACSSERFVVPDPQRSITPTATNSSIDWSDQITVDLQQAFGLGDREFVIPMDVSSDGGTISFTASPNDFYLWTGGHLYLMPADFVGVNSAGHAVSERGLIWKTGKITQLLGPCGTVGVYTRYISEAGEVAGSASTKECGNELPAIWDKDGNYIDGWPSELNRQELEREYTAGCYGMFEAINDIGIATGNIRCLEDYYKKKDFVIRYANGRTSVVAKSPPDDAIGDWCAANNEGTLLSNNYLWNDALWGSGGFVRLWDLPGMPADFLLACGQGFGSDGSIVGWLSQSGIGAIWKNGAIREFPTLRDVTAVNQSGDVAIGTARPLQAAAMSIISTDVGSSTTVQTATRYAMVRLINGFERLDRLCRYAGELRSQSILSVGDQTGLCAKLNRGKDALASGRKDLSRQILNAVLSELDGLVKSKKITIEVRDRFRFEIEKALG